MFLKLLSGNIIYMCEHVLDLSNSCMNMCIILLRTLIVEIVSHDKKVLRSFFVSHTLVQYGYAPLGMATNNGDTKTVQRLLEAGANVNYQNKVMTVNVQ